MPLVIYDSNRPGAVGVLVDTDKQVVIKELTKVTDGWGLATDYKRKTGIRCKTERVAKPFTGFEDIGLDRDGEVVTQERPSVVKKYNIATRFSFMEQLIDMVIAGISPSCIITGPGGIGKTYTVVKALESQGYKDGEYVVIKGFTTPLGLYRLLHDNRRAIILFDDCDSAFKEPTALNLLKGALDTTERRMLSWNSSKLPDDIEPIFEFKGRIIFVSNVPLNGFDQTLISRSMIIDLQMSREEILDRIETIATDVIPLPADMRKDVIEFLKENKDSMSDLNIRTYIKVAKIRAHGKGDWKGMAEFMCCS
jgi:hypothetical protein